MYRSQKVSVTRREKEYSVAAPKAAVRNRVPGRKPSRRKHMNEQLPEAFLTSCGLAEALVLRVNRLGQSRAQRFRLKQPFALIGAHPNATLQLNDPQVQRKHAFLQVIGGNLFCLDLGSRSGIHWPDGPRAAGWLQPTETLTIGPFQIRLDDSDNLSPLGPRSESPLERRGSAAVTGR